MERNRPMRELLKRPLEIEEMMIEKGMSKKKVKKRLRNPNKNFDKKQKVEYQFCENNNCCNPRVSLITLKVPITTAADDKFWDIFPNFRQK